jgi:hypothetical protein
VNQINPTNHHNQNYSQFYPSQEQTTPELGFNNAPNYQPPNYNYVQTANQELDFNNAPKYVPPNYNY